MTNENFTQLVMNAKLDLHRDVKTTTLCDEEGIYLTEDQVKLDTLGYMQYKQRISTTFEYKTPALIKIIDHRDKILQKYESSTNKNVEQIIGMAYSDKLFFPVDYDGTVVDSDDVFAAVYYPDYLIGEEKEKKEKDILWILLTNDPYIPLISMVYIQPLSLIDRIKKIDRNDFIPIIEKACPNLKYPISNIDNFMEIIESEYSVKGRVDKNFIMQQLQCVKQQDSLYDSHTLTFEIGRKTESILREYGYNVIG